MARNEDELLELIKPWDTAEDIPTVVELTIEQIAKKFDLLIEQIKIVTT